MITSDATHLKNLPLTGSIAAGQTWVGDGTDYDPGGHNALTSGIQGGTTDEYYHLTNSQHTALTAITGLASAKPPTVDYSAGVVGTSTLAARSDHTHDLATTAHSEITGQTEDDHHNRSHALDSASDHSGSLPEADVTFDNSGGHDHDGSGSKAVDHTNLTSKGTNTHAVIDAELEVSRMFDLMLFGA